MNEAYKSLELVDRSNCESPKRPKIQVPHMVWSMHGTMYAPILHTNASNIGTNDTVKSLEQMKKKIHPNEHRVKIKEQLL